MLTLDTANPSYEESSDLNNRFPVSEMGRKEEVAKKKRSNTPPSPPKPRLNKDHRQKKPPAFAGGFNSLQSNHQRPCVTPLPCPPCRVMCTPCRLFARVVEVQSTSSALTTPPPPFASV